MTWIERDDKRTRHSKTWRDSLQHRKHLLEARLDVLHYEWVIDSGDFNAEVNCTPVRIDNPIFDGWRITDNGWHYALGKDLATYGEQDGWVGFGGRQGARWVKFRLLRVGYLHWATRAWEDVGGAPDYDRSNLTRETNEITFDADGSTQVLDTVARWDDLWTTPGGGALSVSWRAHGGGLKEEIKINQAGREWIATNHPPSTPASETYFGFVFRLDVSDIPKWVKNEIEQDIEGDFDDTDGNIELRDTLNRLLAFMPFDRVYSDPYDLVGDPTEDNTQIDSLRLTKRIWKDGDGNHYLLVGAKVADLNTLHEGDLTFDPTFTDQPAEASAKDTYLDSGASGTNYGTADNFYTDAGAKHVVIEFDCSSITDGSTCDSCTFSMWSKSAYSAQVYDIYSLHSNVETWTEGGATWDDYKASISWPGSGGGSTSGTDYEADASPPTITFPESAADTEAQADLTTGNNLDDTRIEGWFGATNTNYGLIVAVTGSTSQRQWHSSSATTSGYRPKISIGYTEPYVYGAAALAGSGTFIAVAEVTHVALSTLAGSATFTAIAHGVFSGSAQLDGSASLTAAGSRIRTGASQLDGAATLIAAGSFWRYGVATLGGVGSIIAAGNVYKLAKAALDGVGTIAAGGRMVYGGFFTCPGVATISGLLTGTVVSGAALAGVGSIIPAPTLWRYGTITLNGVAVLTAEGEKGRFGYAELAGEAAVVVDGYLYWVISGSQMNGRSSIRPIAVIDPPAKLVAEGVGSIIAAGTVDLPPRIILDAESLISGEAEVTHPAQVILAGVGDLAGVLDVAKWGAARLKGKALCWARMPGFDAVLSGTSTFTATAQVIFGEFAALPASSSLTAAAYVTRAFRSTLSGVASLAAVGTLLHTAASQMDGSASLVATALRTRIFAASLAGSSTFTAEGKRVLVGTFDWFRGDAYLTALGRTQVRSSATLTGDSSIYADPHNVACAVSSMAGEGDVVADGSAILVSASSFPCSATITPLAYMIKPVAMTFPGAATLTALPHYHQQAEAVLPGVGSIPVIGNVEYGAQATLGGSSSIAAHPHYEHQSDALLQGAGSVAPLGCVVHQAISSMSGAGAINGYSTYYLSGVAPLAGEGTFASLARTHQRSTAALAGEGGMTSAPALVHGTGAILNGASSLVALAHSVYTSASQLDGVASTVIVGARIFTGFSLLPGVSSMAGVPSVLRPGMTTFVGVSSMAVVGNVAHSALSLLEGSATFSGLPSMEHKAQVVLAGTSAFVPTGNIECYALASFSGAGALACMGGVVTYAAAAILNGETIILPEAYTISSTPVAFSKAKDRSDDRAFIKVK